jgi:hypothetical protein
LGGIAVEPRWDHTAVGTREPAVILAVEFRLPEAPADWVQVRVGIPPTWKSTGQREGWTSFYFLANARTIRFEMELRQLEHTDAVSRFPVLVQTGNRTGWLNLYLQSTDHGFCAAVARVDERGRPLWFSGDFADSSDRGYWSLLSTVSEALQFVGNVLDIDIHPPSYLSPWCGVGMRSHSAENLIEVVCTRAGCVIQRERPGEYVIDFAPGYVGDRDASWFVLIARGRVTLSADRGVPADVLVPALLEATGARLGPSPDLSGSTIWCSWTGSFRGALEAVCESAQPPLWWEEQDGGYVFSRRDQAGEAEAVRSP